jgi:NADPH-dependent ferric siderophore reductase
VIGDGFDWYWLIGDEAALPAIGRFLEQRPQAPIRAVVSVSDEGERIPLSVAPSHVIEWTYRPFAMASDPAALIAAVTSQAFPTGDGFVWIAAEAGVAKSVRAHIEALGHPASQLTAKGYWTV